MPSATPEGASSQGLPAPTSCKVTLIRRSTFQETVLVSHASNNPAEDAWRQVLQNLPTLEPEHTLTAIVQYERPDGSTSTWIAPVTEGDRP